MNKILTFSLRFWISFNRFSSEGSSSPICLSRQIISSEHEKLTVAIQRTIFEERLQRVTHSDDANDSRFNSELTKWKHFHVAFSHFRQWCWLHYVRMGCSVRAPKSGKCYRLQIDSHFKSSSHACGIPQLCSTVVEQEQRLNTADVIPWSLSADLQTHRMWHRVVWTFQKPPFEIRKDHNRRIRYHTEKVKIAKCDL